MASDGAKAHGWPHPTLLLADELWSWADREPTLLGAMMTAMLKNPECRFLGISTAAASLDSPLGRLRTRALSAPNVERKGGVRGRRRPALLAGVVAQRGRRPPKTYAPCAQRTRCAPSPRSVSSDPA